MTCEALSNGNGMNDQYNIKEFRALSTRNFNVLDAFELETLFCSDAKIRELDKD